jgi:hypothetical protein
VNGTRATNDALEATGSVTFDETILGMIIQPTVLNSTNDILGLSTLTYSNGTDHGLELNPTSGGTSDVVTLNADRHTVTFDLRDAAFADDARIITSPVPEPGVGILILVTAAAFARRRNTSQVE